MTPYQTKAKKLPGTSYREVIKHARILFHQIEKRSRRKPYIRSAYFNKEKIFFDYFWVHHNQKTKRDRLQRLKYLACAIELIKHSNNQPDIRVNPNLKREILYRFAGLSKEKELFYVQIKGDKTGSKFLMSVFPSE